ncbi:MAG: autotransporter-associated beta strand repeat-containing protein [Chthoniobacterales bacterium]
MNIPSAPIFRPALFAALLSLLGAQVFAQSYSITNGAWSNAATWNTPPVNGASASVSGSNTVTFQAGDSYIGGYSIYTGLDVGQNFRANPGSGVLNVTGGTLRTGSLLVGHDGVGYGGTINVSGGQMIIDGGTMLFGWGASSSLNVSGSGTVTMSGTLDIGNPYFIFGHVATSSLNITSNGTVNIQRAVTVQTGSVVDVNGASSTLNFSGAANLNLVAGSKITAENGGNINMSGGQVTINGGEGLWLGAAGTTGTLNLSGGTWTQTGELRLGVFASGNGVVNQTGGVFELGSNIDVWGSSASSYNLSGGTFRLLGNYAINNYSGGSSFNITGASAGTNGNVTVDTGTNNFTVYNTSTFDNASATLTKTGAGTLTFSGSQLQIANGALDMQAGTIETASSLAIGIGGSSATGTMSGGRLRTGYIQAANFIIGYGQTGTFTQSNGTVDVGSLASVVLGWAAGGAGTYTLNGGTFSASTNSTYIGYSGGAGTVNVNGGSFAAHNLLVGGNSAASGTLNLNGGTFGVAGTFTVDSGGTVNVNSGGSLSGGSSGNITVGNNGVLNFNGGTGSGSMNLLVGGGGTVDVKGQTLGTNTWANLVAQTSGAVLKNSSSTNASIATGNTIWIWDAATNLTINTIGTLQIDSRITSSGQATQTGIIKEGAGILLLNGNLNDYTGVTQVNAGTLRLDVANGLGSTSSGTTVASGAQLSLSGVTVGAELLTISGTGTTNSAGALRARTGNSTWQGKVTLAADAKIFSGSGTSMTLDVASGNAIEATNYNLTIDGAGTTVINDGISLGTGGIIKIGSGTTTLAASNSYSGATDIQVGRLTLSGNGRLGSGAITISNANTGTLQLSVTGTYVMGNNISGAGALFSGSGETRFTGLVTTTGWLTVSSSTVRIGNGGASGSFSGNTVLSNSAAQLVFDRSDAYTHIGTISGSGDVTKSGAGTTTLTGSNSFSGALAVNSGVLDLNASTGAAAAAASTISVATNAILLVSKSDQVNNSAAVTLSGGTIQRASGVSEVFGSLNLTTSSFLDFSGGTAGTITFSGISYTPSSLLALNIGNFNQGSTLVFQTTNNLSLNGFTFSGTGGFGGSTFDGNTFTITAIPEPATVAAALGLVGLMIWPMRRRLINAKLLLGRSSADL